MPKGTYKRTEETKRKISKSNKGKKRTAEHRKNYSKAIKGRKITWGEKISATRIESIKKGIIPRTNKGSFKKGNIPWNPKGTKRESIRGNENPNWQGGKSFEQYTTDWTDDLKESIRKRDDYICQLCGIHQDELCRKLDVHHIDYIKENLNPENLITLCRGCHMKTNANRDYWKINFC